MCLSKFSHPSCSHFAIKDIAGAPFLAKLKNSTKQKSFEVVNMQTYYNKGSHSLINQSIIYKSQMEQTTSEAKKKKFTCLTEQNSFKYKPFITVFRRTGITISRRESSSTSKLLALSVNATVIQFFVPVPYCRSASEQSLPIERQDQKYVIG